MKVSKKILALLLAVVAIVGMFAGCAAKEEAKPEATNDMKVGFIFLHDENSTYDKNFIDAANAATEKLGIAKENVIFKTNVPEGQECLEAANDLVDQGCTWIFADSFGHEAYMIEAAKAHPEVQFCHATGTRAHTEGVANFHNAFASIYEGRYLAGIAAGMKLNEMIESGKITADQAKMGYVGAFTYAEVVSGYTSFYLGARSVCPSVKMEVTFTGSWYDEMAEKEAANNLISRDCVLISQHADSMGAPTACETAGVPNVSYNGSTLAACPNTFIVSSRINWAPYFEYAITAAKNGEAIKADWVGTIGTESVLLTDVNTQAAAEGTQEAIDAAKAKLVDGSLKVFATTGDNAITIKGAPVESYLADVDSDAEMAHETEVVADGYFHESEYRSAPYFDAQIDGITLLDVNFG